MASRRHANWLLLPAAFGAVAAILGGCTYGESTIAQPGLEDICMNAFEDTFGIPNLGNLGGDGNTVSVNINSGNVINAPQIGPNNVSVTSITGNESVGNGNGNVSTCCVNGRCCVKSGDGP